MKRTLLVALGILCMMTGARDAFAQDRGLLVAARTIGGADVKIGKQYAVLIAIDRYREWSPLRNPVKDARAVKDVLSRRYYIDEFIELYDSDATSAGIRQLFGRLIDTVGPADSVLIYYAGHGYTDRFQTGFWIPVDGGKNIDSQDRWIPNQQIRNFISQMKARSVALFADACFSGDLLNVQRGAAPTIDSEYFRSALRYSARQVLTSGASESVPDESEFARQFRNLLESNTEAYLDPLAIYDRIRRGVSKTLPLFGTLPGQEAGGSFVLFLRDGILPAAMASASATVAGARSSTGSLGQGDAELIVNLAGGIIADVYINGEPAGATSSLIQKLPSGIPLVVEVRSGYEAARAELTLRSRELKEVSLKLERLKGNLYIEANEKTVDVYLDGERVGPLGGGLFRDVAAGERTLELRGQDLYHKSQVVITGNETSRVTASVAGVGSVRLDVPAEVSVVATGNGQTRTMTGPGAIADLAAGTYTLAASGRGYLDASTSITIVKGKTSVWKAYTTGQARIQAQPAEIAVSVDGAAAVSQASALNLEPGTHKLAFSAPGYHGHAETVRIEAGKATSLIVQLVEFDRATLEIPVVPFGANVYVAGLTGTVNGLSLSIGDIPSGYPVSFAVDIPCPLQLDPAYNRAEITLSEGAHETLELPVGYFSVPWLPEGAELRLAAAAPGVGNSSVLPLTSKDGQYVSPPLASGSYVVELSGAYTYATKVAIETGSTRDLPGYREALITSIGSERAATSKQLKAKSGKTVLGWMSFGTGLASSAAATAAYILGAQALDQYKAAVSTADVQAARSQVELYGALFPAALSVGGLGLGLSPILWFSGPDPNVLKRAIEAMDESLKTLRGE